MGHIFYIMGKSSTGKNTIYEDLVRREDLKLRPMIPYTTRPIRCNEREGVEYHFVDEARLQKLTDQGRVIELREYHTVEGIWKYFTVNEEDMDLDREDYLAIGTLESFRKVREYFGEDRVLPIYIETEDGLRLERAMKREKKQDPPKYEEMCRRFLADQQDFSEEKLEQAGIRRRFPNNEDREICMEETAAFIREWI